MSAFSTRFSTQFSVTQEGAKFATNLLNKGAKAAFAHTDVAGVVASAIGLVNSQVGRRAG